MNYKIIDNFLSKEEHKKIHDCMISNEFPWFYQSGIVYPGKQSEDNTFLFTHVFYNDGSANSEFFKLMEPILKILNVLKLHRIKANLYTRTDKIIQHGFHIDIPNIKHKTALYYVNSNNGKTVFENGLVVDSVANRFVEFDTDMPHTSTTCTDERLRCNINFNYML